MMTELEQALLEAVENYYLASEEVLEAIRSPDPERWETASKGYDAAGAHLRAAAIELAHFRRAH